MHKIIIIIVASVLFSCTSEPICGIVTGGGIDRFTGQYFLRVDGVKEYVDMKTYDSYFVNDLVCLE